MLTVDDILNAANAEVDPSDEHLADLKRVTAEYANYRKRTEANREVERERASARPSPVLLPVLDDLDRAEKHGDLEGDARSRRSRRSCARPSRSSGSLRSARSASRSTRSRHEAIFQQPSDEVEVETVADVVETGYLLGGTLLRAKVVVKTPLPVGRPAASAATDCRGSSPSDRRHSGRRRRWPVRTGSTRTSTRSSASRRT